MTSAFRYQARNGAGRIESGAVEAASREEALARLHARNLTPLSLSSDDRGGGANTSIDDKHARELSRTLAQLLQSGLSLAQALRFAAEELDGSAAAAARAMREAAERGERPSRALAAFTGPQARLLSGVLLAGETSGRLSEALEVAAASFARSADLRARVITALIYPAFVVSATLAVLAAFVFFVVPTLGAAFEGNESALPASTRSLLALSAGLQDHGPIIAASVLLLVLIVAATPAARKFLAGLRERVLLSPLGLGIALRLDFAAFASLASLSLSAGVPAAPAFEAAAAGMRSSKLKRELAEAVLAIRGGERPSQALERCARPPRALIRLMQVGEETAQLANALAHAGQLMAGEAENRLQRLGALAGPILTLILGGMVASVVLSLFLGLLSISDIATAG